MPSKRTFVTMTLDRKDLDEVVGIFETFINRCGLGETASLHGAAPFRERKAGAQPAFSSPITATNRAATSKS